MSVTRKVASILFQREPFHGERKARKKGYATSTYSVARHLHEHYTGKNNEQLADAPTTVIEVGVF